jgi:conjugal transfer/entry exclusion protein
MRMKCLRIATLVAMATLATQSTYAWDVVFDPSNYAQNVVTAAKAVKGEIYQDTNIIYQYQMEANQLLQSTGLDPTAMKAQYTEITGDISQLNQYRDTLTQLYGSLQQGSTWLGQAQTLISSSGKSPTQWYSDMNALYQQGNSVATNLFQTGNNVFSHSQQLAQRRADLQSQLALTPTAQATATLTTHYLDIVSSQNADLIQMTAARQQADAQDRSLANTQQQAKMQAMQSFTTQQEVERAQFNALPSN